MIYCTIDRIDVRLRVHGMDTLCPLGFSSFYYNLEKTAMYRQDDNDTLHNADLYC